ncbi:MAG: diguanylate cyclase [Actinobacteria bacterium]|nr:diguanylate cyclase [Actinomycetota bacterium]
MDERGGTWLAPTAEHRARMVDMERRTRHVRSLVLLAVGGGTGVLALKWGWRPLGVFAAFALCVPVVNRAMTRSERPENWLLTLTLLSVIALGGLAALTGGATSLALPWLVLPVVAATTVFGANGFLVTLDAAIIAIAVIVGTTADNKPDAEQVVAATAVLVIAVGAYVWELMTADLRSRRTSVLDPLTGLLNRSTLAQRFEELRQQAMVAHEPVALVIIDIDHFKRVNDELGHAVGDVVLREVAAVIRTSLRSFEPAYRLGGEEFLMLLPGMDEAAAIRHADHIRRRVAEACPAGVNLTVSAGVAAAQGEELLYARVFDRADARLYIAKGAGRNRVEPTLASVAPPMQLAQ